MNRIESQTDKKNAASKEQLLPVSLCTPILENLFDKIR